MKHQLEITKQEFNSFSEDQQNELLKRKGNYIQYIDAPTLRQMEIAVKQNGYAIRHLTNPPAEIVKIALTTSPTAIKFVEDPSEEQIAFAFEKEPEVLAYIKKPTKQQIFSAISRKGGTIQYVKNPTVEMAMAAIDNNPMSLSLVQDYIPKEYLLEIVKKKPKAIRQAINQVPKDVQLLVLEQRGAYLRYVKNPSEDLCLAAVLNNPIAIEYVPHQTAEIKRAVIDSGNTKAISFLELNDYSICRYLVERRPELISLIDSPSKELLIVYKDSILQKDKRKRKAYGHAGVDPAVVCEFKDSLQKKIKLVAGELSSVHFLVDNQVPLNIAINEIVNTIDITQCSLAVGFAVKSGLGLLHGTFERLYRSGVTTNMVVGSLQNYCKKEKEGELLNGIDVDSVKMLNLFISNNIINLYTFDESFYHGKFYLFKGKTVSALIIGSSNLSVSGFRDNKELNTIFIYQNGNSDFVHYERWFGHFIKECTHIPLLDEALFKKERQGGDTLNEQHELSRSYISKKITVLGDEDIRRRMEMWLSRNPTHIYEIVDIPAFKDYVAFQYDEAGLSIFESFVPGNAFYCFSTSSMNILQQQLSGLTKSVILNGNPWLKYRGYHIKDSFMLELKNNNLFH